MEEETILNLMVAQHALIEAYFFVFKSNAKKPEEGEKALSDFMWEIKKHFFVEESAIFNFLPWSDPEISGTIEHLKNEHTVMSSRLVKMEENLQRTTGEEIEELYKMLVDHRETEEKNLYPLLDQKLSEQQKRKIIIHINEVPLKKI